MIDKNKTKKIIRKITQKYINDNPIKDLTYRPFCADGILRDKKYFFVFNFDEIFPDTKNNEKVYAWAKYISDEDTSLNLSIYCKSPVTIYQNGEIVFKSNIFSERYSDRKNDFTLPVKKGINNIILRFTKTPAGFGGKLGPSLGKNNLHFYMPTKERGDQEGFIYTNPTKEDLDLSLFKEENYKSITWYPKTEFEDKEKLQMENMYGLINNAYAIGYTIGNFKDEKTSISITHKGAIKIFIDDKLIYDKEKSDEQNFDFVSDKESQEILIYSYSSSDGWGFNISFQNTVLTSPCNGEEFIYLGPFSVNDKIDIDKAKSLNYPITGKYGKVYWRLNSPKTYVRPYNDCPLFGTWGYPVGVTLYGMLQSAKFLNDDHVLDYIKRHVQVLCDTFDYAMYDKEKYQSTTTVHHLLTSLDSLDDCGAFASLLLEAGKVLYIKNYKKIADFVADYIYNKQIRLKDGTFYRKNLLHHFHENTLWADDLYMSVPFLARYSHLSNDDKYITDGARQFLGYKKLLYMEDKKLFSHCLDLEKGVPTGIPWGRGNGWIVFSLTEILYHLDENHPLRDDLINLLNDLLDGILSVQGESGMWHQVLDEHDSYKETSCTAMFICAFSRGIRYNYLKGIDKDKVIDAVKRAWKSLCEYSIDQEGNVYGVCRGSEFSYTSDYYKYDLLPKDNDPHGVGIVLMAGYEYLILCEHLESKVNF